MTDREQFEKWCQDRYVCTDYSFTRTPSGVYVHTVSHRSERMTFAAVQMLWEAWSSAIGGSASVGGGQG